MEETERKCSQRNNGKDCLSHQNKRQVNKALVLIMFLICVIISVYQSFLCVTRYLDYPITVTITEPDALPSDYPLILVCGPNVRYVPGKHGFYGTNQFNSLFNRFNMINPSDLQNYPWETLPLQTYYESLQPANAIIKISNMDIIEGKEMTLKPIYTAINGICFYTDGLQITPEPTFMNMVANKPYTMSIVSEWDFTQVYPDLINEWNILYGGLGQLKMRYIDIKKKTRMETKDHRCHTRGDYHQIKCLEKCILKNVAEKYDLNCSLPWLNDTLVLPICDNYNDYKHLIETLQLLRLGKEYIRPCRVKCPERCTRIYYSITGDQEFGQYWQSLFLMKLKSTISEVKEFPAYEFTNLMGDIGGITGFLLGLSALGVFKEIIAYAMEKQSNNPV